METESIIKDFCEKLKLKKKEFGNLNEKIVNFKNLPFLEQLKTIDANQKGKIGAQTKKKFQFSSPVRERKKKPSIPFVSLPPLPISISNSPSIEKHKFKFICSDDETEIDFIDFNENDMDEMFSEINGTLTQNDRSILEDIDSEKQRKLKEQLKATGHTMQSYKDIFTVTDDQKKENKKDTKRNFLLISWFRPGLLKGDIPTEPIDYDETLLNDYIKDLKKTK
jgi:hypothetical protein